jgi:hypothetical protein
MRRGIAVPENLFIFVSPPFSLYLYITGGVITAFADAKRFNFSYFGAISQEYLRRPFVEGIGAQGNEEEE